MSMIVVGGLSVAGRSRHVYDALFRAARDGVPALLVVPTAGDAASARSHASAELPVGLRVATLDGVLQAEWGLKGDGRRPITRLQRDLLCARALIRAGVAERPGRGAVALLASLAARQAATGVEPPDALSGLAGRLIAALQSYRALIAEVGGVEPAETARILARSAPASVIGVLGFAALEPADELALRGWARSGADVLLEVPWSAGVAGTQPCDALMERLRADGADIVEYAISEDDRPRELRAIATRLFSNRAPCPGEGAVRLGEAQGDEAETQIIAAITRDLIDHGAAPDSITIAFADAARHAGWLRRSLAGVGVAADWDVYQAMGETPLARGLLRLWSFCSAGMEREDVVAFMRSPFSGVATSEADRVDAVLRRSGPARGPGLIARAGRAAGTVKEFQELVKLPITSVTGRKWKALLDTLLSNAHPGVAPVLTSDGALDAAVHRAFCHAVEEVLALGEGATSAEDLMSAFSAMGVGSAGPRTPGAVLVTSVDRVPASAPEHLVLGGLTASEFPRRGADDRIEGDAVRMALAAVGAEADPEEQARSERLAFYLAVTAPRRSLALVRRESDDEGRALRESVFWDEFLDLYRPPGEALTPSSGIVIEHRSASTGERRTGAVSRRGALAEDRVLEDLAAIATVSPGAIESYIGCPYRWFVERRLRPEAPDVELDRMAVGRVAHEALAAFYRRWWETAPRVTTHNLDDAIHVATGCLDEAMASAPRPQGLEEAHLLGDVAPAVVRLVERDASFLPEYVPRYVEWSFGMDDGDEPIDLDGVSLRGRADRIDVGPEGIVIVDYKRSRAASLADIRRDGLVQLQLYAVAASKRLGIPVAGGLYRSLSSGEDRGFVLGSVGGAFKARDVVDTGELESVLDEAVAAARDAVAGMRSGHIEPSPKKERCAYCAAAPFCPAAVS